MGRTNRQARRGSFIKSFRGNHSMSTASGVLRSICSPGARPCSPRSPFLSYDIGAPQSSYFLVGSVKHCPWGLCDLLASREYKNQENHYEMSQRQLQLLVGVRQLPILSFFVFQFHLQHFGMILERDQVHLCIMVILNLFNKQCVLWAGAVSRGRVRRHCECL